MVDRASVGILGIDHVQVAIPRGGEDAARAFYGVLLGLEEIPKPEPIRARGGVWFRAGAQELHLGVEEPFAPARKAHPGLVASDLARAPRAAPRERASRSRTTTGSRASTGSSSTTRSATGSSCASTTRYNVRLWTRGSSQRSARSSSGAASRVAAERLGVTQPAVSLQVRALEKRLGTQLLDRSGRRVEPTEAGLRLYRGAQRLLALEEQVLAEVAVDGDEALSGTLEIGASTGPGGIVLAQLLCEFQARNPELHVALWVFDTQTIVERVAARELELGVVGAARRHRGVVVRAVLPRRGDPRLPARPPVRRTDGDARRAARRDADPDAGGRRRPADDRGRAPPRRRAAARPRRAARARAPGVGHDRRPRRLRGHVHLAHVGRVRPRGRDAGRGARRGARARPRDLPRARERPRRDARRADVPRVRARAASRDRPLVARRAAGACSPSSGSSGRCSSRAGAGRRSTCRASAHWSEVPSHRIEVPPGADSLLAVGGGSAIDTAKAASAATGLPVVSVPTTYSGAEWTAGFGVRTPERRMVGGGGGANLAAIVYEVGLTLDLPRAETVGTAMNALAHCAEALYVRGRNDAGDAAALAGARADRGSSCRASSRPRASRTRARAAARRRPRRRGARARRPRARARDGAGARRDVRPAARGDERALPPAGAPVRNASTLRTPSRASAPRSAARTTRPRGSRSSRRSAASGGCGTSACPRPTCPAVAAAAAERAGNRAMPRPATPEEIEALLRSIYR